MKISYLILLNIISVYNPWELPHKGVLREISTPFISGTPDSDLPIYSDLSVVKPKKLLIDEKNPFFLLFGSVLTAISLSE